MTIVVRQCLGTIIVISGTEARGTYYIRDARVRYFYTDLLVISVYYMYIIVYIFYRKTEAASVRIESEKRRV